jgi:SAM-dependent methyltransferase
MSTTLQIVGATHKRMVHGRRALALAQAIGPLLEPGWRVLDVGCGDGRVARAVLDLHPDLSVVGYDVLVRAESSIAVRGFDGSAIPEDDHAADAVMLIDVLHHTADPMVLLRDAARVARRAIILKDHRTSRPLARPMLRFMDWVGNRAHGVALPYRYWSARQWRCAFEELNLKESAYRRKIGLYPPPASWLFERGLHFLARLEPADELRR